MKGFKITGAILATLLLLLLAIPLFLVNKLEPIVLQEANNRLNATMAFKKLNVSLLSNFPQASISLNDLVVVGHEPFEGDTLISAQEITVVVNLFSLFGDSGFEVSKILLQNPQLAAIAKNDGKVNWDIVKSDSLANSDSETETGTTNFKLQLKDVQIKDAKLSYEDEVTQTKAIVTGLNWRLNGDMSAQQALLVTEVSAQSVTVTQEKMTWINQVKMGLEATIDANLAESSFKLKENKLHINAINATLNGEVTQKDSTLLIDITLDSQKIQFKELLSLIPAFYTQDFEKLTASGELQVAAWVKGTYSENLFPAFATDIKVTNGSFKYADLPKAVEQIEVALNINNPGGDLDATVVDLSTLSLVMAGQKASGSLKVTHPMTDPDIATALHGVINLGAIKEVYPLPDSISLNGLIKTDLKLEALLSSIEKQNYERITAQGNFLIEKMQVEMKDLPAITIWKADAQITPAAMVLNNTELQVGKSDMTLKGKLTNYLAYALKDDVLAGELNMSSKLLDLNELMATTMSSTPTPANTESASTPATTTESAVEVPTNLNLKLNATVGEIAFQQMNFSNFVGEMTIKQGEVAIKRMDMNGFGGKLAASGNFSTAKNPKEPEFKLNASITDASFEQTFNQLELIQKVAPLFAQTGGKYSLSLNMSALLDSTLSPRLNSVNGNGEIKSADIKLQNLSLFSQLASTLNDNRLEKIEAKDVKVAFSIDEGKITTAPFDLKMSGININLSGTTNLEQQINYKAILTLPSGTNQYVQNIPVEIGGTFTSPTVKLGIKEMIGGAVKDVLTKEANKLLGGIVGDSLANGITGVDKEALLKEAKEKGDKLIEVAKKEGQALVDKANNPLLKIAAQKSADMLLKTAQEKAQELLDQAAATKE